MAGPVTSGRGLPAHVQALPRSPRRGRPRLFPGSAACLCRRSPGFRGSATGRSTAERCLHPQPPEQCVSVDFVVRLDVYVTDISLQLANVGAAEANLLRAVLVRSAPA